MHIKVVMYRKKKYMQIKRNKKEKSRMELLRLKKEYIKIGKEMKQLVEEKKVKEG